MSSIPCYMPVFTAASTPPSVPADCPHCHWRIGWFVVWSRRCWVHCCTCHRSSMPTSSLSVISLLSFSSMAASSASGFWWDHLVCHSLVGLFAVSCFHPFSHDITPLIYSIIFGWSHLLPDLAVQCWYFSPCFIIWVSHSFSSRFSSHTSKVSFIIQIWIFSVFSQYLFNCSSLTFMSLAIVSIPRSIRLRAANFPPIWVWNTWLNFWFLKFIQVKRIPMLLGQHSTFSFILKFASTMS